MKRSVAMIMLQVVFWGFIVSAGGLVVYKVGKKFTSLTNSALSNTEGKK